MPNRTEDRQSENVGAPSEASADSAPWAEHEHKAEVTHAHAQQLIDSADSPELANHAVEVAAVESATESVSATKVAGDDQALSASTSQARLAASLGYSSYLDLFEASKPVGGDQALHWLITADSSGKWTLWNDSDFEIVERFDTRDAAANAALSCVKRKPR
jgi:hypothetical protein